jgi:hypothetical protein
MDAIKYLVSGVDPLAGDAGFPDGGKTLQDIFSRPEVFLDRVATHVPTPGERRRRRGRVAGILAVAAAAVTAGVLLSINLGPIMETPAPAATFTSNPAPSSTSSTHPTLSPAAGAPPVPTPASPAAPVSVSPDAEWQTYASADGKVSFEHPVNWKVLPKPDNPEYPAVALDVQDQQGNRVASLHYGASGGIGGACAAPVPYAVLDSVELVLPYNTGFPEVITPRFAFRVLLEADRVTASYGITSSAAGKDGKSCMFYNVVNGPTDSQLYSFADNFQVSAGDTQTEGLKTFRTLDEARAYTLTPEYAKARRMITSLKIQGGQ